MLYTLCVWLCVCVPWHQSQTAVHSAGFSWRRSWSSQLVLLWAMNRMQRWAATQCSRMPCVCPMRHTLEWLRGWLQQTGQLQTQGENAGWVESWELFGVPEFRYAHMGGKHVETKITTSRWWATGRALCKDGLLARLAESTGRGGSFWGYLRSKFNVDWVVGRRWNPRELSVWLSMSC